MRHASRRRFQVLPAEPIVPLETQEDPVSANPTELSSEVFRDLAAISSHRVRI